METTVTAPADERPNLSDAWTLLIVAMRRNNLPPAFGVRFSHDMTALDVEFVSECDLSKWAMHFGQTRRTHRRQDELGWDSECRFRWCGYHATFKYIAWDSDRKRPVVNTTDALVDELAAGVTA